MAKRKRSESDQDKDQVQDQPERDVFDEDDEDTEAPPVLPPGHPDAAVESQDAPGGTPTQQKDESTQADQDRAPEAPETAANERVLGVKGDLQPIVDQKTLDPMATKVNQGTQVKAGEPIDTNSPEFKEAVRKFFLDDMKNEGGGFVARQATAGRAAPSRGDTPQPEIGFKVIRGMVGAFPEGSVIPDMKSLGVDQAGLQRLLDADVIQAFKPEKS